MLSLLLLACCTRVGISDIMHVPAEAATIQVAIDQAADGDEVVVAAGIWRETINLRGKAIVLRGAAGAKATILDGTGLVGSVLRCVSEESGATRIEGFTITGGSGDVNTHGPNATIGGGLLAIGSSPTVVDCVFRKNAVSLHGGAVYCGRGSNPSFLRCTFIGNQGEKGGAVFNIKCNPRFTMCTFIQNVAVFGGGAVYNDRRCSPTFKDCKFDLNEAIYNGGAIYDYESHGSLSNCDFSRNMAAFKGGAVYVGYRSDSVMANCKFITPSDDVAGRSGITMSSKSVHGACCIGNSCIIATRVDCLNAGGAYSGEGTICEVTVTLCPDSLKGDLNQDGEIDQVDMAVLMMLWK